MGLTLVYKRTHNGDPSQDGCFGVHDCMGRVRGYDFNAVIGIGGIGAEAKCCGINGKINWIGIGATPGSLFRRGPLVTFDHFVYYGALGDSLSDRAPNLARRMYASDLHYVLYDFTARELAEIDRLLEDAKLAPPSPARSRLKSVTKKFGPRGFEPAPKLPGARSVCPKRRCP